MMKTTWTVMAMRAARAGDFALTVSADHIIGRYSLAVRALFTLFIATWGFTFMRVQDDTPADGQHGVIMRTKHAGNGAIALRDDGRVCAVGGWDGRCAYTSSSFSRRA